jgi:hypothetical protein
MPADSDLGRRPTDPAGRGGRNMLPYLVVYTASENLAQDNGEVRVRHYPAAWLPVASLKQRIHDGSGLGLPGVEDDAQVEGQGNDYRHYPYPAFTR